MATNTLDVVLVDADGRRPRSRGVVRGVAQGVVALRADLNVEDTLDVLYGPLWLRLLVGHRPPSARTVDRLLALVWPGLVNPTKH